MLSRSAVVILLLAALGHAWASQNAIPADLVLLDGRVLTVDAAFSVATALAVRDGRFIAVGSNEAVRAHIGSKTRVIDGRGRTVVPGLIDTHVHALGVAEEEATQPFRNLRSTGELQAWIRDEAQRRRPETWIWTPRVYPTRLREHRFPTRQELDLAAPQHPVVVDGAYAFSLNSAALGAAGITRESADPPGGAIVKDAAGEPTGLLRNVGSLLDRFRARSSGVSLDMLEQVHQRYLAAGITSVIERGASLDGYNTYAALRRADRLRVRATVTIRIPRADDAAEVERFISGLPFGPASGPPPRGSADLAALRRGSPKLGEPVRPPSEGGDEWLKVGPLKIVADGGLLIGTSFMREPYGLGARELYAVDDPRYRGFLTLTPKQIASAIAIGHRLGWQMVAHVTGDAGVDVVLDAIEAAQKEEPTPDRRHTLLHAYFVNPETAARAARLRVLVDTQPAWYYKDADALSNALGRERLAYFIGLRTWRRAGVGVAINTDHMFGLDANEALNPFNPFLTMYAATTRRTESGRVVSEAEAVSRPEALRMMTSDAARFSFDEKNRGSIEPGKLGDFAVLDDHLLTCPDERLRSIRADITVVGGRVAYERPTTALAPVSAPVDRDGDWRAVGRDSGAQRFSPLTQITTENVAALQQAWTFDTGSLDLQVTPLVIDGVMYLTGGSTIFALEPETGKQIWKYQASGAVSRRGVAYWPGDAKAEPRLYSGAGDGRMVALHAMTGAVVAEFGERGFVDLKRSVRGDADGQFMLNSPPVVYKDIVITGGANGEGEPSEGLYGDIRGWDARSGKLLWSFHTVPRAGEPGAKTWDRESWRNRSGTNVWSFMTVDVDRGLVFAPTGSPTSDFYGGDRKGKNLYGNSLLALDANTGTLKWFQQLVHHDIWDWDLPAAPTLIEVTRNGRKTPAVALITKMSTLFIFDRVSGEPLFGLEERPVPQSDVPGETTWPTQPFPVQPPPLARTTFDEAKDFYALTPEHAEYCRDLWNTHHMYTKGMFTPPSLDATMVTFPSTLGGGNWSGLSYDPARALVFANIMNLGQVARMEQRTDPKTGRVTYRRTTPWGRSIGRFWNPETKVPCSAPPFGELVAVDVNRAAIVWRVPLGVFDDLKARGFAKTGTPNIGGTIATAGGVVFIGGTIDRRFRAFDARTGAELWETMLEASAHATPMTFMGRDRRQYVVIAAGGNGLLQSQPGSKIVAFALPPTATP